MAESDYLPKPGGWYDTATRRWVTPQDSIRQVQSAALGGGSGMDPQVAEYMKLLGGDPNYGAEPAPSPQGVPPVKLGRFTVPSWLTDAVVNGVASTPMPGNLRGGQGFAAGALQGFAQNRMGRAQAAQADAEAKRKEYDERQKAAKRLHELAGMQVIAGRKAATGDETKENNAYTDITDDIEAQKALKGRGAIIPPKNSKGRIMVPSSFFGPREQKEPKPVVDPESLTELVETNTDGYKYINMAHLVGKSPEFRQAVYAAAKNNGAVMLTKEQADAVSNVDVAMMNVGQLERDITGLLPKDANGRLIGSPKNKLRAYFQTSDDLASWGANRNRAIQILRAAAGSHGLRINEAEILYSVENDIPKIDDTEATAIKKLARVREQLKNVSKAILVRDRSAFLKQEKDKRDADSSSVDSEVNSVLKRP